MLDVCTTLADDLGTKVEALNGLEVDWDALIGPLALRKVSKGLSMVIGGDFIRGRIHPAQLAALARGDGSVAHQPG